MRLRTFAGTRARGSHRSRSDRGYTLQQEREEKMADEEERPFKAEYAKSSRAGCKQCKGNITKDTLRMAKMVQVGGCVL